ncbi:recombination mediator RecR [Cloacibacillus evryensis]|uniref:Recombination protein RecR n=1 Tax=Cloacibacillus evryensis TaxID=508460 RepID=A0AAW5K307_9BACT|nr:recombination mediator RecR [Cloacibacillus evryensis]EHL65496.1 recombination protein RecR [Synergistes sp. 3_1_syn1]MCQ4764462.1 recombination mediator RecR [Cloacibacillus evryensis]MCQ4812943.1 recombination mediator RecR [Cloacibacillus evryensis]MEA5035467.1 recombination mediator RecR [Cloacibacillus evryensis]
MSLPGPVHKLIKQWSKLPGVGEKTARRMVFYLLRQEPGQIEEFGRAIIALTENIRRCSICGAITDIDPCPICTDPLRNGKLLCIVESEEDCVAMEQAGIFNGIYHVLGGRLSPLDDEEIPEESIERLRKRVEEGGIEEIILATSPRIEGDLTAYAIQEALAELPVKISRLSYGLPVGGSIGFADRVTLHMAMESRKEMS